MPPDLDPGELRPSARACTRPPRGSSNGCTSAASTSRCRCVPDSTRTAGEAAEAVGCEVGQIVKSLVFMRDGGPVMVLCAGDRRVAAKRLGLHAANADQARAATGFSIGGIPPLGHDQQLDDADRRIAAAVRNGLVRGGHAARRVRGRHRVADRRDCRWRGSGRLIDTQPRRLAMADLPAPTEGFVLTHFIVSNDVERSRRFYSDVLGGEVVMRGRADDRRARQQLDHHQRRWRPDGGQADGHPRAAAGSESDVELPEHPGGGHRGALQGVECSRRRVPHAAAAARHRDPVLHPRPRWPSDRSGAVDRKAVAWRRRAGARRAPA